MSNELTTIIRLGGVPEHFNLPCYLALEQQAFVHVPCSVQWVDYPGGTGAMCAALRNNELDIAILLTEGIVADLAKGNPSSLVQVYTQTPLVWGVHTSAKASFRHADDLQHARFAISRWGSGSHLMAYVYAQSKGWTLREDQFVLVGTIDKARESMAEGTSDVILWEKFMTKPYVDAGELLRLDECPTPWSCFVVAVRNEMLDEHPTVVHDVLNVIQQACTNFMYNPHAAEFIANRFHLKPEDARQWLAQTQWNTSKEVSKKMFQHVIDTLENLQLLETKIELHALFDPRFVVWV